MEEITVPRVARGWILGFCVPVVGVFVWATWTRLPLIPAILITTFVLLLAGPFVQQLNTTLSMEGVSQLSLSGRIHLAWRDVKRVTLDQRGTVVLECSRGTRIRISPMFYGDFDRTLRWIAGRVPHVWPRTSGGQPAA